jgi:drug/metabolite transporter (DMT)-like permease
MGIAFAFLALFSWGIGDFLIQRSARKFGDWVALFYITAFGSIVLFPFIYRELPSLSADRIGILILFGTGCAITLAALLIFESMRRGKLSVVEPIYAMEVPITAALGVVVAKEYLSWMQSALIVGLLVGILLVATRSFHHLKNIHAERGVWFAVLGTIGMGVANFLFGIGARETSPLMVNWFASVFIVIICILYLANTHRWGEVRHDLRHHKKLIVSMCIFDNLAWISYTVAVLTIPIAIAIGISESYIALAAILGIIFNREKLVAHQKLGLMMAALAVIILAFVTSA